MIELTRIVRTKRKTLALTVTSKGEVIARAPLRMSEERIRAFATQKQAWIAKQLQKIEGAGIELPSENLEGYPLLLLGERYEIKWTEERNIRLDALTKTLYLPKKNGKKRLVAWLKENALRILTAQTAEWAKRMGVSYQSVAVSSAKTRWGSCTADNKIRYTYRLLYAPRAVVEYVIVHELAHTKYKNHSKAFWAFVEGYIPDWKSRRKWLKERGGLMEIF